MKLNYLFLVLLALFGHSVDAQCWDVECNDELDQITAMENNFFEAMEAQSYYWEICGRYTSIIGSNTSRNLEVSCGEEGLFQVRLVRFIDGTCIESCETYECTPEGFVIVDPVDPIDPDPDPVDPDPIGPKPLPDIQCFGFDPVYPLDINSAGKLNRAFFNSHTQPSFNNGLTYNWTIVFKNGNIINSTDQNPLFRELCPTNPVMSMGVVISNGVTERREYSGPTTGPYVIDGFTRKTPDCSMHEPCDPYLNIEEGTNSSQTKKINGFPEVLINQKKQTIQFVKVKANISYNFYLYNLKGELILNSNTLSKNLKIDKLKKGIYIYNLISELGEIKKGKLIKE